MRKGWLVGGLVAAGATFVATVIILKLRRKDEEDVILKEAPSSRPEEPVQEKMEFSNEPEVMIGYEFDKFRTNLDSDSRADFDLYYGHLGEVLLTKGMTDESKQVVLLFLGAIVHRNRVNTTVFNEFSRYMLEGNAELLPAAIQKASQELPLEQQQQALDVGRKAMDIVIGGFVREEYRFSQVAN